jgi:hypothetical protein
MEEITNLSGVFSLATLQKPIYLIIVALIAVGYLLKTLPFVSNRYIPAILGLLSLIVTPIMVDYAADTANHVTRLQAIVGGLLLGAVYWLIAWLLHNKVLKFLQAKLGVDDDTIPPGAAVIAAALGISVFLTGCIWDNSPVPVQNPDGSTTTIQAWVAADHKNDITYAAQRALSAALITLKVTLPADKYTEVVGYIENGVKGLYTITATKKDGSIISANDLVAWLQKFGLDDKTSAEVKKYYGYFTGAAGYIWNFFIDLINKVTSKDLAAKNAVDTLNYSATGFYYALGLTPATTTQ